MRVWGRQEQRQGGWREKGSTQAAALQQVLTSKRGESIEQNEYAPWQMLLQPPQQERLDPAARALPCHQHAASALCSTPTLSVRARRPAGREGQRCHGGDGTCVWCVWEGEMGGWGVV